MNFFTRFAFYVRQNKINYKFEFKYANTKICEKLLLEFIIIVRIDLDSVFCVASMKLECYR